MAEPDKTIAEASAYYKHRAILKDRGVLGSIASQEFKLSYNSAMESLEPVYFWIIDFMDGLGGNPAEKLVDTFQSTVGSGHFSELMGKATRMQEEGMKIMQTIGVLIKSVINIIYDLRQFELRINDYKSAESNEPAKKEAGLLGLKQIWMDNVDIKRGNSSIKAMTFSQQGAFVTLLNAFMKVQTVKEIDKEDLNDIVKRVLKQRFMEFEEWRKLSKSELTKRYNIQKHWLKSQVDSLKLYSRWAQPYFKAAEELRMGQDNSTALVKAFNTIVLKLTVLKTWKVDIAGEVYDSAKNLPKEFLSMKERGLIREFYGCAILDFTFRGIPQRVEQHYGFGGKSDVKLSAFALNQDELDLFKKKFEDKDITEALKLVKDATENSLAEIQEDINYFLKDVKDREDEEKEEQKKQDTNPFSALFGLNGLFEKFKPKEKKDPKIEKEERLAKLEKEGIEPDNYAEKVVRTLAELTARKMSFTIYDVYKKAHGMASVPYADWFQRGSVNVGFTDI